MKNIFIVFIVLTQTLYAQETYFVEKLKSRIRFSGESINMKAESNIGFLGHGYEVFGLVSKYPDWYFGVNSYAAITGIRSGFIVFGISTGVQKKLYKNWLTYDLGLFMGGGGGSGAPDGGGLMIRPHADLQANISKKIGLRAGISAVKFPTGAISSLNFNIGAVINTHTYLANTTNGIGSSIDKSFFKGLDVGLLSMNLFNYSKGPLKTDVVVDKNASPISVLGLLVKSREKNHFYGALKVGGAFTGGVDGFMMLLTGLGYELPLTSWLFLDVKALVGGAGGGNVQFGGGLATQIEAGLGLQLSDYFLSLNIGNTYAPNGNFKSNHLDIALGKKFNLYSNANAKRIENIENKGITKEDFTFTTFNRAYFSGHKKDKNGRLYNDVFNSISFEVEKKFNEKLSIIAATVWAYQGDYGAYAEGWLGLQYYYPLTDKLKATAKGLLGAGGGGGINLGSGLAYQYAVGLERNISKRWSFVANVGQVRPVLNGNFTPVLIDLGLKLNISQLVYKN